MKVVGGSSSGGSRALAAGFHQPFEAIVEHILVEPMVAGLALFALTEYSSLTQGAGMMTKKGQCDPQLFGDLCPRSLLSVGQGLYDLDTSGVREGVKDSGFLLNVAHDVIIQAEVW